MPTESLADLEARLEALAPEVRERVRDELVRAVGELQLFLNEMTALDRISPLDVDALATRRQEFEVFCRTLVDRAEAEHHAMPPTTGDAYPIEMPCRFCGTTYQIPNAAAEPSVRRRLQRHLETLHPKQWEAVLRR